MTLRQKLLLPFLFVSLLMGGYIHYVWTPRSLQQAEQNYVASVTIQLGSVVEGMIPPLLSNQLDIVYENLDALKSKNPGWRDVRLVSPSGKQIYPLAAAEAPEPTGENFRKIEMPIKYLDMNLGTLIVVLDMTPTVDKLRQQNDELTMLLFAMLAVMFLTFALELELAVKRPLRALNDAARKLAAADYDVSLPGAGKDEVGTLVGSFAFMRDELHRQQSALVEEHRKLLEQVAERKRAEDEVNALNRQLEQRVAQRTMQLEASNKELESFSYSVSHDLRTPLRAIDGFSRILLDDYSSTLDAEGQRLLNVVRENTKRMSQLIDDILSFSRTGRAEIAYSEIDMEQVAHAAIEELQPSIAGSKLQLEIEPLPPATGDRAMMHQVFVNLLSNAIKFSRTGEAPRIKVGATVNGDETVYYVQDNGVGFDMQFVGKLFSVFQRLHSVDKFEGTGIGLAIVKRIISRHGGRVWAEGKINEGATIYFALPKTGSSQLPH